MGPSHPCSYEKHKGVRIPKPSAAIKIQDVSYTLRTNVGPVGACKQRGDRTRPSQASSVHTCFLLSICSASHSLLVAVSISLPCSSLNISLADVFLPVPDTETQRGITVKSSGL